MTKDEYEDFALRYKGCGACFPMYHTLSRFEKMWFSAIQKDVAELEKENAELKRKNKELGDRLCNVANNLLDNWCRNEEDYCPHLAKLEKENAELKEKLGDVQMQKAGEKSDLVWKLKTANEQKADQLTEAKEIIKYLCGMVRELNNPNVQLTNVDYSLSEAERFIKE